MSRIGVVIVCAPLDESSSAEGALVKVDGRETLLRSIELFVNREGVGPIVVGLMPNSAESVKQKLGSHLMILGVKAVVGATVAEQLAAAAAKFESPTHVVVHDAARPIVSPADLDALLESPPEDDAVALGCTVPGILVQERAGKLVPIDQKSPVRQLLSPIVLKRKAFDAMAAGGLAAVLPTLKLIDSTRLNIRVNSAADAGLAKANLNLLPKPKAKGPMNPFEEASW